MGQQVLQVLVFCVPFYDFLEQVGRNAAHSFKSETPILDAMYVIGPLVRRRVNG
jgi:hypothetical protein